jgi:glycosyltransferase involved in cell wall biosynthesis
MRVLYVAPVKDSSGYGEASRNYIKALHSVGVDVVARHLKFDKSDPGPDPAIDFFLSQPAKDISVILQHTTPNTTKIKKGLVNILYMAWETSLLPKSWPEKINQFNAAMVPCEMNVKALKDSGVTIPIYKVPHAFDLPRYKVFEAKDKYNIDPERFIFYNICQLTKKKGIDRLLIAYFTEFKREEPVALLLKTYINANFGHDDLDEIRKYIDGVKQGLKLDSYPRVYVNNQIMDNDEILRLHASCDTMIAPSRGEGFNIPAFESMAMGTPTIVTQWGGFKEYAQGCLPIRAIEEPVFGMQYPVAEMYTGREMWGVPDLMDLRNAMRSVYQNENLRTALSRLGRQTAQDFSYNKIGSLMKEVIERTCNAV